MIMCYNFFVGMCSRCSELIHPLDKISKLIYNKSQKILGGDVCLKENSA